MRVVDPLYPTKVDPVELHRALELLAEGVFEIRIPKAGRHRTIRGYFNDREAAAQAAAKWSGSVPAVYITLNPVNPALLARASNRLETYAETTTSDADILSRRWMLVDLDPKRPAGISASDAEHKAALARAEVVRHWLAEQGWPEPVVADSGNGAHLLYRLALAIDAENTAVIQNSLKALAIRFDTPAVSVDTSVYNLSRISKLYGTWACKGDNTADRPHRLSRILSAPQEPEPVALELLEDLAREAPEPETRKPPPHADTGQRSGDFFANVNDEALRALSAWVPRLLPGARPYRDGYRVSSRNLQRDCEEDLGIQPDGIKDFGVHDTGDRQGGRRTPIDLVIEYGMARDAKEATLWLCDQLGISPDRLGWRKAERQAPPSGGTAPPEAKPRAETPPPQENAKPEFIQLADFIAGPPSSSYLIKHVLPAVGLGQVFGSSNVGKSFLLIDLAMHLASGRAWRGQRTKKIPVLYIAAEGMAGLAGRMKAWTLRYGSVPDLLYVRPYSAQLTVAEHTVALAQRIQELPHPPRFIILDTLAANFGVGDENSAEDMANAMNGLRILAGDWFALCAHHSGHADKTRSRGHSSLYAALDVEIQVERAAKDSPIKVAHTKCRDMERMDPMFFNLESCPLPWADEDGEPLNSAVLVPAEGYTEPEKGPTLSGQEAKTLRALQDLYDQRSAILGGQRTPRVTVGEWREAMTFLSNPKNAYRLIDGLEKKGCARIENSFAYLV